MYGAHRPDKPEVVVRLDRFVSLVVNCPQTESLGEWDPHLPVKQAPFGLGGSIPHDSTIATHSVSVRRRCFEHRGCRFDSCRGNQKLLDAAMV